MSSSDFHTHSNRSDGTLAPRDLIAHAAAAGVTEIALTDHDTVSGLAEARAAAQLHGMELIDGVELTATWRSQDIHILGFWIDPEDNALLDRLAGQTELRRQRMHALCSRLEREGLPGAALFAELRRRHEVLTRSQLAALLTERGFARDAGQAFKRFLSRRDPTASFGGWPPIQEAIEWIRAAGGRATLAHPLRYGLSGSALRTLAADFAAAGGAAIEVISGNLAAERANEGTDLANLYGLSATAGSDFHDPKLSWNVLGRLAKLPPRAAPLRRG